MFNYFRALFVSVTFATFLIIPTKVKASEFVLPLELAEPNFLGLGVGGYPDYFGSDDYTYGAAPIGRIMIGDERFIKITVNDVRANILDHPNWRFGPGLLYRLSRSGVEDDKVALPPGDRRSAEYRRLGRVYMEGS